MCAAGRLNVMIPGNGVSAIFGFCDIRRFTDATECLQEEVMSSNLLTLCIESSSWILEDLV